MNDVEARHPLIRRLRSHFVHGWKSDDFEDALEVRTGSLDQVLSSAYW